VLKTLNEVICKKIHGAFNVIHPISHTIAEISYMIFQIYSLKPNILYLKDKIDIPSIYIPTDDIYHLNSGYISLLDGLKEIIDNEK
jgi:hypothetical protein